MIEWDVWSEEVLARARGHLQPRAEDAARVLDAVREQLPEHSGESAVHRSAARSGAGAKPARLTAASKLIGFGVLTGGIGFYWGFAVGQQTALERALRTSAAPIVALAASEAAVASAPNELAAASAAANTPDSSAAVPADEPAPVAVADTARQARRSRQDRSSERSARARAQEPESLGSSNVALPMATFSEALELLRKAQAAQRAGRAGDVFEHLAELDRRASKEMLREERLLTAVLAACDLGDSARAQRLAAELQQLNASSIYNTRLRNSCVGEQEWR